MNNIFKTYIILFSFSLSFSLIGCSDDIIDAGGTGAGDNKGTGEMVLFTVGTTANSLTSRAEGESNSSETSGTTITPGKSYYMPEGSRFVCRMYFCAHANDDNLDVSGNTDFMSWFKVSGSVGNSLYWNKFYEERSTTEGLGGVDALGNDYSADAFYWQNRKKHVFLAMTDLNNAKTNTYGIERGKLRLNPSDASYTVKSDNDVVKWVPIGYHIEGVEGTFANWDAVRTYINTYGDKEEFKNSQANCTAASKNWDNNLFEYQYGWECKFSSEHSQETIVTDEAGAAIANQREYGPMKYYMYYETFPYKESDLPADRIEVKDENGKLRAYKDKYGIYLCNVIYEKDAEGKETGKTILVKTDDFGNTLYNESNPRYTFYYYTIEQKQTGKEETTYNVNAYDLTKGEKTSMAQQPDICMALTSQEPLGATQASNRVNLYFKHQFSQIQVNLRSAKDNSVQISADQLKKVELLGTSEVGYVCVDVNQEGKIVHEPMYKPVEISSYSIEHLEKNPYGTSFEMFPLTDDDVASGYLKSFNCIAFGQLQAIRITWTEETTKIDHTATFRVTETNLQNLQSGYKYIWNMELRRGTLAVVRTEIDPWIVPSDELEYTTNGTVK